MAKKCTKKHDARAKLFVSVVKPVVFFTFSLPSPLSDLKVPINTMWLHQLLTEEVTLLGSGTNILRSSFKVKKVRKKGKKKTCNNTELLKF